MAGRKPLCKSYGSRKRRRESEEGIGVPHVIGNDAMTASSVPDDTSSALLYLRNTFPVQKLSACLPPIFLKHQLYSIIRSKTDVDRDINLMRDRGEVIILKLSSGMDEYGVVYTGDYRSHLTSYIKNESVRETALSFLDNVLIQIKDVSLDYDLATGFYKLSDDNITDLLNCGVLLRRDVGSWWISVPGTASYLKFLVKGRKAILRIVKQRKYKEIPQIELERRSLTIHSKLGTLYHLHDVIGAELVTKVRTTTGTLIRYIDLTKQNIRKRKLIR